MMNLGHLFTVKVDKLIPTSINTSDEAAETSSESGAFINILMDIKGKSAPDSSDEQTTIIGHQPAIPANTQNSILNTQIPIVDTNLIPNEKLIAEDVTKTFQEIVSNNLLPQTFSLLNATSNREEINAGLNTTNNHEEISAGYNIVFNDELNLSLTQQKPNCPESIPQPVQSILQLLSPESRNDSQKIEYMYQSIMDKKDDDDLPIRAITPASVFKPEEKLIAMAAHMVMEKNEAVQKKQLVISSKEDNIFIKTAIKDAIAVAIKEKEPDIHSKKDDVNAEGYGTSNTGTLLTNTAGVLPASLTLSMNKEIAQHEVQRYLSKSLEDYQGLYKPHVIMQNEGFTINVDGTIQVDAQLSKMNGQWVLNMDISGQKSDIFVQKITMLQERLSQFGITGHVKKQDKKET